MSSSTQRSKGGRWAVLLLTAPFFVLFAAVVIAPLGYALWLSLFSEQSSGLGFGGTESVFTGLGNYLTTLADQAFRDGFAIVALYAALYIPLMLGGALALALLLDSGIAILRRFFQLALFMPHVVPGVIAGLIWLYLYLPGISPIVSALRDGGIEWDFLGDHVLGSVVNVAVWEWIGYNMIIFFAALQAIPREVLEAATMDGAGPIRVALRVKLPLIRGAVITALLFTVIGSLQLFNEPMVMDGVSNGIVSTWTPNMYSYAEAFGKNDIGQAAAASVLLAVLAAVLSYFVTKWGNKK
ncbi:multiple sugar transport system permease protein [Streptosporangium subroseum]|uniref:Multiple sugar transport system permease protein n=1 Tax=Streptosporangium subroseum TaxID=106412 RepID=A0A239LWL1_9ACTN|nr:sugar ABC transporter permease [Streptosporangium subroseum]SNT34258.1 multiple sugar transport system permease protein [Streptosporangium subroseum]